MQKTKRKNNLKSVHCPFLKKVDSQEYGNIMKIINYSGQNNTTGSTGKCKITLMSLTVYFITYRYGNQCECYIHGHSAGGTNPSLVEAMTFGKPILAFDVIYNRETTENKAFYFNDCEELISLLSLKCKNGDAMKEISGRRYTWSNIAKQYEALY